MKELTRQMTLENGQVIDFIAGPIHPFWRIRFTDGPTPDKLQGMYSDFDDAVYAVKRYVERRRADRRTTVTKDIKVKVKD